MAQLKNGTARAAARVWAGGTLIDPDRDVMKAGCPVWNLVRVDRRLDLTGAIGRPRDQPILAGGGGRLDRLAHLVSPCLGEALVPTDCLIGKGLKKPVAREQTDG